jgi:predicted XRE-type DNA-binding protein
MWAWKAKELAELPVKQQLEKEIGDLVRGARDRMKGGRLADTLGIPESEIVEATSGYFSGFEMDDTFLFLTSDLLLEHDTLHIVIIDSLSRFEVLEWKNFPVVFVTDAKPRWLGKMGAVFKAAYPVLSDRKIAIVVPNKDAYSNFKQRLFYLLLDRLEVEDLSEL